MPYTRVKNNSIASPAKTKKAKKRTSTNASGNAKYHFCFSPIDLRSCKKMWSLISKDLEDSSLMSLTDTHYIYLYMDQDRLTHIDFIGETWTYDEIDVVFSKIRSSLRKNGMYFAFTDFKED